jgi:uncharacterized membrane protein HdeD (DUF308 family)
MARTNSAELQTMVSRLAITRGIISIIFGIIALVWPGLTLVTLGVLLAIWLLVGGATGLVSSIITRHKTEHWVFRMLVSVLELGVGAYLVQRPGITVATVIALVSIVLVVEGVVDIITSFVDPKADHRIFAVLLGFLGIVAGIVIWRYPVTGGLAFVWILGLYALIMGALNIAAGVEVEKS